MGLVITLELPSRVANKAGTQGCQMAYNKVKECPIFKATEVLCATLLLNVYLPQEKGSPQGVAKHLFYHNLTYVLNKSSYINHANTKLWYLNGRFVFG